MNLRQFYTGRAIGFVIVVVIALCVFAVLKLQSNTSSTPEQHVEGTKTAFVSVGDVLGAMTVVSAEPFNHGQYSTDPKMMQFGPQNAKIILKGPIEILGMYSHVQSGIGFDGYCMLVTDAASLARLPVLPVGGIRPDIRSYSFCFRNGEMTQKMLGEESRTVTLKIDNFELNAYPAEVMSWADLVSLVEE